ncbi:MAG: serine/threonine-protein kinase [Planctomycetaceae bacterium]
MSGPSVVEDIFLAALEQGTPEERAAFLDTACKDDADLRRRVERLLGAYPKAGEFLEPPARPAGEETVAYVPGGEQAGTVIAGRYKLLEQIGEGGMGAVWVAEQIQPVRRKAALKLIKAGMDSKSVLARFEAERQALALMDHPHIAKVLDGGVTEQGRPFFVMEYVKGVPLTQYCDENRLTVEERLGLFIPVCQAVQHAHQKGIVHRDLKPSNVLVCLYDGRPVPKVIDFGLAKAMHQPLTEHTLHTAHGVMMGTPLCMSPEQAELNNLDVDTRTGIYSLGVILYELLTGTTPLEKQRFQDAAWQEMLRLIKEEDPPRPSTRLSSRGTLPSVAAQRRMEPVKLSRLLKGELDWIVMKALEKDRRRRQLRRRH